MAGGFVSSTGPNTTASLPRPPNSSFNYIVAFAAALGGLLFGYEIGIVEYSPLIDLQCHPTNA
jgi:hypothetical protein